MAADPPRAVRLQWPRALFAACGGLTDQQQATLHGLTTGSYGDVGLDVDISRAGDTVTCSLSPPEDSTHGLVSLLEDRWSCVVTSIELPTNLPSLVPPTLPTLDTDPTPPRPMQVVKNQSSPEQSQSTEVLPIPDGISVDENSPHVELIGNSFETDSQHDSGEDTHPKKHFDSFVNSTSTDLCSEKPTSKSADVRHTESQTVLTFQNPDQWQTRVTEVREPVDNAEGWELESDNNQSHDSELGHKLRIMEPSGIRRALKCEPVEDCDFDGNIERTNSFDINFAEIDESATRMNMPQQNILGYGILTDIQNDEDSGQMHTRGRRRSVQNQKVKTVKKEPSARSKNPVQCLFCEKKFEHKNSLTRHVKETHGYFDNYLDVFNMREGPEKDQAVTLLLEQQSGSNEETGSNPEADTKKYLAEQVEDEEDLDLDELSANDHDDSGSDPEFIPDADSRPNKRRRSFRASIRKKKKVPTATLR